MTSPPSPRRGVRAAVAAGATSLALLALNLIPRRGVITTSDQGEWPGSWTLRYGWPSTAYSAFGYDPGSGGSYSWTPEALAANALVASAAVTLAVLLSFWTRRARRELQVPPFLRIRGATRSLAGESESNRGFRPGSA